MRKWLILGGAVAVITFGGARIASAQSYQVEQIDPDSGNITSTVDVPDGQGAVIDQDGNASSYYQIPEGDESAVSGDDDDGD